ncbi:MAG: ORF6N domain-containing protein [Acidobacteriota bacterium]
MTTNALAIPEEVLSAIHHIEGLPDFMLASEAADLYGVAPKRVTEAVRRNPDRFPADFVFRLTKSDVEKLRSQNAAAISRMARIEPLAFTHEGMNALSGVLKSSIAAARSVQINRGFSEMERRIQAGAGLPSGAPVLPDALTPDQFDRLLQAKVVLTGAEYLALKRPPRRRLALVPPSPAQAAAVRKQVEIGDTLMPGLFGSPEKGIIDLARIRHPRPLTRREKREIKAALAETPRPTHAAIARRVGRPRRTVDRYIETLQGRV